MLHLSVLERPGAVNWKHLIFCLLLKFLNFFFPLRYINSNEETNHVRKKLVPEFENVSACSYLELEEGHGLFEVENRNRACSLIVTEGLPCIIACRIMHSRTSVCTRACTYQRVPWTAFLRFQLHQGSPPRADKPRDSRSLRISISRTRSWRRRAQPVQMVQDEWPYGVLSARACENVKLEIEMKITEA